MDGVKFVRALLFNIGWSATELIFAAVDKATGRDPDAELRRFLETHPDVTVHWTDGTTN